VIGDFSPRCSIAPVLTNIIQRGHTPISISYQASMGKNKGELLQGTLDMLILSRLAKGAMHGFGIAEHIQQVTDDTLRVEEGSLYPALHRLEADGMITSEWGASSNNRRAKFYRLTPRGKKQMGFEVEKWQRLAAAINRVIEPA
jgi:PadR family transcriptional regulator, regulatory protein PadR